MSLTDDLPLRPNVSDSLRRVAALFNQTAERMSAGGRRLQIRTPWAAAIARFCRSVKTQLRSVT
jgi:hypothetical protein